jgi:hypothetical protein
MVAGARDADRQDFVCINRRRTNVGANSRLLKKAIRRQLWPLVRTPHSRPGALTYIKGDCRIALELRAFLAAAPCKPEVHCHEIPREVGAPRRKATTLCSIHAG